MVNLTRRRIVAAISGPTYVAVMRPVDRVKHGPVVVENRRDDRNVREVTTTKLRIIQDKEIAFGDVVAKVIPDSLSGRREGADMHGNAFALGDELAVRVEDSGGKIAAGVEDLRHRCAQHDLGHLQGDR